MPGKPGKITDILKKAGAAKAFESHKADETEFGGGGDMPAGVTGKARLVTAKLDVFKNGPNTGKPYLMLAGVVLSSSPDYSVMRATKMIGLHDDPKTFGTPKTTDERIAEALNEMRKMGIATSDLDLDDWEAALAQLMEDAPVFRFHTWAGINPQTKKPGRTRTDFDGIIKDHVDDEPDATADVDDDTGSSDDSGSDATTDGDEDWSALGEAADGGDSDAIDKISEACKANDIDADEIPSWSEAAAALVEKLGEGSNSDEPAEMSTGDTVNYKPKGAPKAIKVEILSINKAKKSATVRDNKAKKKFDNVPLAQLSA